MVIQQEQERQGPKLDSSPSLSSHGAREQWQDNGFTGVRVEQIARALGWFSIVLGLAQLASARRFAHWIGVGDNRNNRAVLRAVGLREIVSGLGILVQPRPVGWLKARVGGDMMDLALLGAALNSSRTRPEKVAMAMAAVAGITIVDLLCSQQLGNQEPHQSRGGAAGLAQKQAIDVAKSITINRPAADIYQFWRNFENLPRIMRHLESVQVLDEQRSRWRAKAPAGMTVEWEAEITEDQPNNQIAWRSLEGADVPNAGSVRFDRASGDRGTVVTVTLQYNPPGGVAGTTLAKLFGEEPDQQVADDLRTFKQMMETGEVVRSDGSLWGTSLAQRPAQPPSEDELMRR